MKSSPTPHVPKTVTKATAKQQMLKKLVCSDAPEQALRYRGFRLIAGVDEVGRGALFGPVVAAAVILPERMGALARAGLKDSKQLTRLERERLDRRIRRIGALSPCGGGGCRDHRPGKHLPGHPKGHGHGRRRAVDDAGSPADRRHAAGSRMRADEAVLWRCA